MIRKERINKSSRPSVLHQWPGACFIPSPGNEKTGVGDGMADNDTAGVSIRCTKKQKKSGINHKLII